MASSAVVSKLDRLAKRLTRTARAIEEGTVVLETDTLRRTELVTAATDVIHTITGNRERLMLGFAHISHLLATRLFLKWDLLTKIPTGKGEAISYGTLAATVGADVALIGEMPTRRGCETLAHSTSQPA